MYANGGLGSHRGLGALQVTAYTVGGGDTHPCADVAYKMRNRDACARMGYNGIVAEPAIVAVQPPQPIGFQPPPTESFAPDPTGETIPADDFLSPDVEGTVISVPGGGGWGPDSPAAQLLSVGGTEVFVEAEEEGPGFGIIEVALAAGVAWILSQSYQRRRKR